MDNFISLKFEMLDKRTMEDIIEGAYKVLKDPAPHGFLSLS